MYEAQIQRDTIFGAKAKQQRQPASQVRVCLEIEPQTEGFSMFCSRV